MKEIYLGRRFYRQMFVTVLLTPVVMYVAWLYPVITLGVMAGVVCACFVHTAAAAVGLYLQGRKQTTMSYLNFRHPHFLRSLAATFFCPAITSGCQQPGGDSAPIGIHRISVLANRLWAFPPAPTISALRKHPRIAQRYRSMKYVSASLGAALAQSCRPLLRRPATRSQKVLLMTICDQTSRDLPRSNPHSPRNHSIRCWKTRS